MERWKIGPRLWRWLTPHPDWRPEKDVPGGWGEMVGSVAWAPADDGQPLVVVDPLVRDVEVSSWLSAAQRTRGLLVIQASDWHSRSAGELVAGGATMWREGLPLPAGVEILTIDGLDGMERAVYFGDVRAMVFGDALIGAGGGEARVPGRDWSGDGARYDAVFKTSLAAVLGRPIEMLLPSHGEAVLADGEAALRKALDGPVWEKTQT
jgi:hypothetical protein